jgi:hypothetical protein
MALFICDTNNGVTALVTLGDYERINSRRKPEYGIFLFTDSDSLDWPVHPQPWFHGDLGMMDHLLIIGQHSMRHGSFGGVPFSNGASLYTERELLLMEITKIAPMHKLLDAFGVTLQLKAVVAA